MLTRGSKNVSDLQNKYWKDNKKSHSRALNRCLSKTATFCPATSLLKLVVPAAAMEAFDPEGVRFSFLGDDILNPQPSTLNRQFRQPVRSVENVPFWKRHTWFRGYGGMEGRRDGGPRSVGRPQPIHSKTYNLNGFWKKQASCTYVCLSHIDPVSIAAQHTWTNFTPLGGPFFHTSEQVDPDESCCKMENTFFDFSRINSKRFSRFFIRPCKSTELSFLLAIKTVVGVGLRFAFAFTFAIMPSFFLFLSHFSSFLVDEPNQSLRTDCQVPSKAQGPADLSAVCRKTSQQTRKAIATST